jgi:hypothetical protein
MYCMFVLYAVILKVSRKQTIMYVCMYVCMYVQYVCNILESAAIRLHNNFTEKKCVYTIHTILHRYTYVQQIIANVLLIYIDI